jgi:nitroreductase
VSGPRPAYNGALMARLLRERRTVSQGSLSTVQEPDHEAVLEAVESARWAPNHHLTEPWTLYVLDPARIARLGELWAELQARKGAKPEKVERKRHEWGRPKASSSSPARAPRTPTTRSERKITPPAAAPRRTSCCTSGPRGLGSSGARARSGSTRTSGAARLMTCRRTHARTHRGRRHLLLRRARARPRGQAQKEAGRGRGGLSERRREMNTRVKLPTNLVAASSVVGAPQVTVLEATTA